MNLINLVFPHPVSPMITTGMPHLQRNVVSIIITWVIVASASNRKCVFDFLKKTETDTYLNLM